VNYFGIIHVFCVQAYSRSKTPSLCTEHCIQPFFLCSVICEMFRLCLAIINELIHIRVWNFLLVLHLCLYMH